jgi:DNA adenine methylase
MVVKVRTCEPRDDILPAVASAAPVFEQPPAKPFLKWVGGKRQLLWAISARVPASYSGRYFEPFLGGGALFFHLMNTPGRAPKAAVLADTNSRLIRAYRGVRDDVERVLQNLKDRRNKKEEYYRTRGLDIDASESDAEVAAWLIYLNKTGYNGLYRVNSKNRFNVPFGRYDKPGFYDPETLRRCADALSNADIRLEDFEKATAKAKKRDFVYFDPPYVPLSATSSFASYTQGGFGLDEQERLRDLARSLKRRGVFVLLSNSSAPDVWRLYKNGFRITEVQATRVVNSKASRRGSVTEVLIE